VLAAGSFDVTELAYAGTFTVSHPSGDVDVLRFTMSSGALHGLTMSPGCAGGFVTVTTAQSATVGSATFDAVSLDVNVDGSPLTFTPADPPTSGFPAELTLTDVTLVATTLAAAKLTVPSFTTQPDSC
jgi:hypothetical protein